MREHEREKSAKKLGCKQKQHSGHVRRTETATAGQCVTHAAVQLSAGANDCLMLRLNRI